MKKQVINSGNAPQPIGPYSQAVLANGFLFISGQIAIDPVNGDLITEDIENETRQVMENIKAILHKAGLDFPNVIKCSIFLTDMNDFGRVNGVSTDYFPEEPPARETIQVSRLPKDVHVEISVIAAG